MELTIKKIIKAFLPYGIVWLYQRQSFKKELRRHLKEQKIFQNIQFFLTAHCNLKCAGCAVFSPLAEEKYLDITSFEQDCKRLAELIGGGGVKTVELLGGEPLLHPKLSEFCKIARKYFENSKIQILTNGILLSKKEDSFWEMLKEKNITILISEYPISLDMTKILENASLYNVNIEFIGTKANGMYRMKFDTNGRQDPKKSFRDCWIGNKCVTLSNGKLYTCSIIPATEYFSKYFNKQLNIQENDSIDIYKVNNINEVFSFLSKAIPFCRYCKINEITFGHKWQISKKDIKEWT